MTFDELMTDFASTLDVRDPKTDGGTGTRTFAFDGNWVDFRPDATARAVVMTAQIGALPGGDAGAMLMRVLLSANFLRQGTAGLAVLGIDAKKDMCCLRRRDSLALLDGKAYAAVVEEFLDILEMWQRRLADVSSLAGTIADFRSEQVAESRSRLLGDGLIRV